MTVTRIAQLFDTTRQTVHRWLGLRGHVGGESFEDKPRESELARVTEEVELSILKLRTTFMWGTARIQQGICRLLGFIRKAVHCVQGVMLSRKTVNNVLAGNRQNGYPREFERWNFFRVGAADELWQIDFKGPFTLQGRKYWFLACIDDYSGFIVSTEQFGHELTAAEVTAVSGKQKRLPKAILSDHVPHFMEQ